MVSDDGVDLMDVKNMAYSCILLEQSGDDWRQSRACVSGQESLTKVSPRCAYPRDHRTGAEDTHNTTPA
jgi:hypothetical protein